LISEGETPPLSVRSIQRGFRPSAGTHFAKIMVFLCRPKNHAVFKKKCTM